VPGFNASVQAMSFLQFSLWLFAHPARAKQIPTDSTATNLRMFSSFDV
jgi:hypothetical protein